jgi:hypothetical protein
MPSDDRIASLEKRVERLEKIVSTLLANSTPRTPNAQDRRAVTEKVSFDWQDQRE